MTHAHETDTASPQPIGVHALVVDDSAVMRSMVIRTLHLSGLPIAAVHEAADGQQGLDALWRVPVDLALVDLNMPVMTGEDMIVALRADPATCALPVIVVSTESSDARIRRLADHGVAFVHKPFTPEQLRDVIRDVMADRAPSFTGTGTTHGPSSDDPSAFAARAAGSAGFSGDVDF